MSLFHLLTGIIFIFLHQTRREREYVSIATPFIGRADVSISIVRFAFGSFFLSGENWRKVEWEKEKGEGRGDASLLETVLDGPSFTFRDAAVEAVTARLGPLVRFYRERIEKSAARSEVHSSLARCNVYILRLQPTLVTFYAPVTLPLPSAGSTGKRSGKQRLRWNEFRCFTVMACLSAP